MKISIISDTHGLMDKQVIDHLKSSDEIWHAGDVGNLQVIKLLEQLPGKIRAVYGNIDDHLVRQVAPESLVFDIDNCRILLIHIAGNPPKYNGTVRKFVADEKPNILVCGHSHILKVLHDKENDLLFINPGACSHHGFHKVRTLIQFELINGKPQKMNVIELGLRGRIARDSSR